MQRRQYLATVVLAGLAGCAGSDDGAAGDDGGGGNDDDGGEEQVLDELVFSDAIFSFDAAAGDELRLLVDNEEGVVATASINNRDADIDVLHETVETEAEFTTSVEEGGVHELIVAGDRVAVELYRS